MKKHTKVENVPLMYIVQPNLNPIKANMQHSVYLANKIKQQNEEKQSEETLLPLNQQKDQQEIANKSNILLPFHEMTLENKINFLSHLPDRLQNIKCEIKSKENHHIGQLKEIQEDTILLITEPDHIISVKVPEIEHITIIDMQEQNEA